MITITTVTITTTISSITITATTGHCWHSLARDSCY